jgi:putative flavoprotein involved in K+ transport
MQDVVIIGAGQAGLATSYELTRRGREHVVLERGRIGQAWRAERWDSFCLVTPNWTITLPGASYEGSDPGGFMLRDDFVRHLEGWAEGFGAPIRAGVAVRRVAPAPQGFRLETSDGAIAARNVVVATSTYQAPRLPSFAAQLPAHVAQRNAATYRNPHELPAGAAMVVGSGQTGCQIAEEINASGRRTYLCVGKAGRLPRRYRGRDCLEWQRDMGYLERTPDMLESPAHRFRGDPHLSGRNGGHTISLHNFHRDGITLLGSLQRIERGRAHFAADLANNMRAADDFARNIMGLMDAHIERAGVKAPPPSPAELDGEPKPGWRAPAIEQLDLDAANITSVVWATGFRFDFSWIEVPVLDSFGYPLTRGSATTVAGLHFMGLNWMHKRKSGIIYGVGEDAAACAERLCRS